MVDCKTVGFFLKISKEVGKAWRKSNTREPHTPFSASFQSFCLLLTRTWIRQNLLTDSFEVYLNMHVYRKKAYSGKMYQV